MPKIHRGGLAGSNSQYFSLSAENSVDRVRFGTSDEDAGAGSNAISGLGQNNVKNIDRNSIIQNADTFNDMFKSFSSADKIHFI